jgi:hypothetical protein
MLYYECRREIKEATTMIRNSIRGTNAGNVWTTGSIVKVGFLRLQVVGARAEKDSMPDIYTLKSLDGQKWYEFIPHNGLHRIDAPVVH